MHDRVDPGTEKRRRFFEAAEPLFARFGYPKVTVEEICRAAGASKRTFYELFSAKADLFVEMVFFIAETEVEARRSHLEEVGTARERLHVFLDGYVEVSRRHPVLRECYAHAELVMAFGQARDHFHLAQMHTLLRGILQEGIERGEFAAIDPEAAFWFVHSLLDNIYFMLPDLYGIPGGFEDENLGRELRTFIDRGLGAADR